MSENPFSNNTFNGKSRYFYSLKLLNFHLFCMQQNSSEHFNEIPPFNQTYYKTLQKLNSDTIVIYVLTLFVIK